MSQLRLLTTQEREHDCLTVLEHSIGQKNTAQLKAETLKHKGFSLILLKYGKAQKATCVQRTNYYEAIFTLAERSRSHNPAGVRLRSFPIWISRSISV